MARRQQPSQPIQASVSAARGIELLKRQHERGMNLPKPIDSGAYEAWTTATEEFLIKCFGNESNNVRVFPYRGMGIITSNTTDADFDLRRANELARQLKLLTSCIEQLEAAVEHEGATDDNRSAAPSAPTNRVFLVHGRDERLRETVARFLERFGLEVIVLHEMPDQGRTIIEKFEHYANVGFAVVLLTGDDAGGLKEKPPSEYRPRARQNVLFEMGFFVGKLGRTKVCALREEGVEIPSDYQGVVYLPVDQGGGWKLRLASEMKMAGLPIDMNRAI